MGMPASQSSLETEVKVRSQVRKTELCRFYNQKKGCRHRSSSCPYAHGEDDLQERPNLRKTSLCPRFMKGCCAAEGGQCQFAHGHKELRKTSAFEDPPRSKTGKHVPHRFSPETSSKDTSQIFLKEAPTSTCVKMNTDNDLIFAHLMPLCSAARETSDDTKDLVTLLLNSAPEFYED